jgi:hypothetical protein
MVDKPKANFNNDPGKLGNAAEFGVQKGRELHHARTQQRNQHVEN